MSGAILKTRYPKLILMSRTVELLHNREQPGPALQGYWIGSAGENPKMSNRLDWPLFSIGLAKSSSRDPDVAFLHGVADQGLVLRIPKMAKAWCQLASHSARPGRVDRRAYAAACLLLHANLNGAVFLQ
jgi:hypothetical protein